MSPHRESPVTRTTPWDELPPKMTMTEVAAFFGCAVGTVRRSVQRGELQAQRLGRIIRVPREAVKDGLPLVRVRKR